MGGKIGRKGGGEGGLSGRILFSFIANYIGEGPVFSHSFPSDIMGSIKVIVQTFHLEASRFDAEMFYVCCSFSCLSLFLVKVEEWLNILRFKSKKENLNWRKLAIWKV